MPPPSRADWPCSSSAATWRWPATAATCTSRITCWPRTWRTRFVSVLPRCHPMSILIDKNTRVLCQGITGSAGSFHTDQCLKYGTQFVGGVTPKKGGTTWTGKESGTSLPVFNTVAEAVAKTGADATMIFVPPGGAADAIMEAADAGVRVIVAITEGIPVLNMARVKRFLAGYPQARLIGPNCPGVITPG